MPHDDAAFDRFRSPSSAFFDKYRPSMWQLGAFANYCYGIEGFPQDRKIRKQVAFELWKDRLQNFEGGSEDIARTEKARRLLKSIRNQQPLYINNIQNNVNFNIQGNNGTINATVNGPTGISPPEAVAGPKNPVPSLSQAPVAPPPPYEAPPVTTPRTLKRKIPQTQPQSPGYDGERSASPSPGPTETHSPPSKKPRSNFAAPAPPPESTPHMPPLSATPQSLPQFAHPQPYSAPQPPRQRLLHLHDQLFKDLLPSQQRILPFLESTLSSLEHIRETTLSHLQTTIANLEYIDNAIREVRKVQKSCVGVLEKVDVGLRGVIEHPLLVGDDEMLTERDESVAEGSSFCGGGGEGGSGREGNGREERRGGEREGEGEGERVEVKKQNE